VDLSDRNRIAVDAAAGLATASGGSVTLLHVIETLQDIPVEEMEEFYVTLEQRAEDALGKWAAEFGTEACAVHASIVLGKRSQEILRHARDQGSDLIVLTSHQIDPERAGGGVGTISHQIALLASCPVLLMR
jgi:nucleotide-binding universal stress UspA family protein